MITLEQYFFFHDVFSDSILNNMKIKEIKDYLISLEKKNIIYLCILV